MISESIVNLDVEVYSFDPIGGVCLFDLAIPWDTMRTLCFHEECLSHPISDMRETF